MARGDDGPQPPPAALLIRRHRLAAGLSVAEAAARTGAVVGQARWGQIEQGFVSRSGQRVATAASDSVLAHMAFVVAVKPEQLEAVGEDEAAAILRTIQEVEDNRSGAEKAAAYFRDTSIPIEERAAFAARFLEILPYLLRREEPPPAREPDQPRRRDSA